ncbi:MAG: glutamine-hydrolyzing carbamoyl-phosphate synthase small subunit [Candidatus Bilamarchaeaceae archaeon]
MYRKAKLILEDGAVFEGESFGADRSISGEVVFNTGMVGYPESLTDPSYFGQIISLTYPLVGNYGVPKKKFSEGILENFESGRIQAFGLIVGDYSADFSHHDAERSLGDWLKEEKVPAITGIDTRALTKKLREKGVMLGKIIIGDGSRAAKDIPLYDPNKEPLGPQVSIAKPKFYSGTGKPPGKGKKVLLVDCGVKNGILLSLLDRGVSVMRVPWDFDYLTTEFKKEFDYDGILVSNGPGDPQTYTHTIENIRRAIKDETPLFGICLGHQMLALALGAKTYKLKYGHRSQNQQCLIVGTKEGFVTSQNHGFAVNPKTLPKDFEEWFINLNDGTNEGIRHKSKPFFSTQFHPEAKPGPVDTQFIFEEFVKGL